MKCTLTVINALEAFKTVFGVVTRQTVRNTESGCQFLRNGGYLILTPVSVGAIIVFKLKAIENVNIFGIRKCCLKLFGK